MADFGALISAGFALGPDLFALGKVEQVGEDINAIRVLNGKPLTAASIVALLSTPQSETIRSAVNDLWSIADQIIKKNPSSAPKVEALLQALGLK